MTFAILRWVSKPQSFPDVPWYIGIFFAADIILHLNRSVIQNQIVPYFAPK
jgi:hypothetical protein